MSKKEDRFSEVGFALAGERCTGYLFARQLMILVSTSSSSSILIDFSLMVDSRLNFSSSMSSISDLILWTSF